MNFVCDQLSVLVHFGGNEEPMKRNKMFLNYLDNAEKWAVPRKSTEQIVILEDSIRKEGKMLIHQTTSFLSLLPPACLPTEHLKCWSWTSTWHRQLSRKKSYIVIVRSRTYVIVWTLLVIDRQLVAFASQPGQCRLSLTSALPSWTYVILWYETGKNANLYIL